MRHFFNVIFGQLYRFLSFMDICIILVLSYFVLDVPIKGNLFLPQYRSRSALDLLLGSKFRWMRAKKNITYATPSQFFGEIILPPTKHHFIGARRKKKKALLRCAFQSRWKWLSNSQEVIMFEIKKTFLCVISCCFLWFCSVCWLHCKPHFRW